MCVPLRSGMTCPFFIGDELNAEGSVFDAQFGKALPTVISMHRIEQRSTGSGTADAHYIGFDLIGDGSGVSSKSSTMIKLSSLRTACTPGQSCLYIPIPWACRERRHANLHTHHGARGGAPVVQERASTWNRARAGAFERKFGNYPTRSA